MDFLKKLFSGSPAKPQKRYYTFFVKCLRCEEVIEGHVDLDNDLSIEFESNRNVYHARKVLIGSNKCFQRMEVELKFTSSREVLEQHVTGGELVEDGQISH